MRRPLPLWLAAVLPATIAGHALAYALSGSAMNDGHHAWLAPVLEGSLALALTVAMWLLGGVLVRARIVAHHFIERNFLALWPRLAILQVAVFIGIERAEGTSVGWLGCLAQVFVALFAAYVVSRFAALFEVCSRATAQAAHYLERLLTQQSGFFRRDTSTIAFALAISAGSRRFGRAPPHAAFNP